jgi:MerC mercury resistance protein
LPVVLGVSTTAMAQPFCPSSQPKGGFPVHEKVSLVASQSWVDSLGASVSIGCAIQCTLFPLLIGVLPLVGLGFLTGDGVEKFFLVTSIILAVGSLSWGFRHHKNLYVFLFLIAGLLLIFTGRVWVEENSEISFVVSGTLVLAAGHLLNRRLCQLCVVCEASEKNQAG